MPRIFTVFGQLVRQHRNQIDVDAYVARTLDDATADRVTDGLGASLGKEVHLNQHIDESLIGGLKLRIGDQMIDASVKRQLPASSNNSSTPAERRPGKWPQPGPRGPTQ